MRYRDYLRLDGACSAGLGAALILLGWPGLIADGSLVWGWAAVGTAVALGVVAVVAKRRGTPVSAPGRWLTDRPVARVQAGAAPLDAARLRRRLVIETAVWVVGVGAWVALTGRDTTLIWVTGWPTLAYGLLQLAASAPRVDRLEAEGRGPFLVARRPGLGTPELTTP